MSFQAMAWAIRQKLPTKEKFTLLMLANYASNEKGDCYPSINTLADETGMSRDSIIRALRSLESSGLIKIRKRMQDGVNLPNFYTLTLLDLQGVVAVSDHGSSCERLGVVAVSDSNLSLEPINESISDATPPSLQKFLSTKRKSFVNSQFEPNDTCKLKASNLGLDVETEKEKFILHAKANGKTFVDWQAAFQTWLLNAFKWSSANKQQPEQTMREY